MATKTKTTKPKYPPKLSRAEQRELVRQSCTVGGRAGSAMAETMIAFLGTLSDVDRKAFARFFVIGLQRRSGETARAKRKEE